MDYAMTALAPSTGRQFAEYTTVDANGSDPESYTRFVHCTHVIWADHLSMGSHSQVAWAAGLGGLLAFIERGPSVTSFRIDAYLCDKYARVLGVYMQQLRMQLDLWRDPPAEQRHRSQSPNPEFDDEESSAWMSGREQARMDADYAMSNEEASKVLMRETGKSQFTDTLAAFLCQLDDAEFGDGELLVSMLQIAEMGFTSPPPVRMKASTLDIGIFTPRVRACELHQYLPGVQTLRMHIKTEIGPEFLEYFLHATQLILDFDVDQTTNIGLPPNLRTLVIGGAHRGFGAHLPRVAQSTVDALSRVTSLGLKNAEQCYQEQTTLAQCSARSTGWAFLSPDVMQSLQQVTLDFGTDMTGINGMYLVDLLSRVGRIVRVRGVYLSRTLGKVRGAGPANGLDWADIGAAIARHGTGLAIQYDSLVIDLAATFCIGCTEPSDAWPLALARMFPSVTNIYGIRAPGDSARVAPVDQAQLLLLEGPDFARVRIDALSIEPLNKMLTRQHGRAQCVIECTDFTRPSRARSAACQLAATVNPTEYAESLDNVVRLSSAASLVQPLEMDDMQTAIEELEDVDTGAW